jgi:ribose/xylose/arabinose/galactoside ABC-type transport system permease subunit
MKQQTYDEPVQNAKPTPSVDAPAVALRSVGPGAELEKARRWASSENLWSYAIWIVLVIVASILAVSSPSFRSQVNLTNILEQNSMLGIVAVGMFVMMVSGGFDLSVGAIGATSGIVGAYLSLHAGLWVAIPGALGMGAVIGMANGILIAKVRINAFVTTFAMASIVTGILFVSTSASPMSANAGFLTALALEKVAGIPWAFIAYVVVVALAAFLMTRTKWGHYVYAVGGNREASYLSGVPVVSTQMFAFVFGGFCAAVGGLILLGQSNLGQPAAATAWPLTAIAMCVIGGVSLFGGEGRLQGTVAATFLLGVITNGLNLLNVSPYIQPTVIGTVVLMAVGIDLLSRKTFGRS